MRKWMVVLLLFALLITAFGCNKPEPEEPEPITTEELLQQIHVVRATEELTAPYKALHEYVQDEEGEWLLIYTDIILEDFSFIGLENDTKNDVIFFTAGEKYFATEQLVPGKPLLLQFRPIGTIPWHGISFEDANGTMRYFILVQSTRGEEEGPPYYFIEFENGK